MTDAQVLQERADATLRDECNLSAQRVIEHFAVIGRGGRLLTFLMALDRVDRWAVDFEESSCPHVFQLQRFLSELEHLVLSRCTALHRVPGEFAEVLAHLTTTRCLYVMRYLSQRSPQFLDAMAECLQAEHAASANLAVVRRRLEALGRARLLAEIFSPERLQRIAIIMGSCTQ